MYYDIQIEGLDSIHTHEDLMSKFPNAKFLYRKSMFGFYELYAHTFIKFYYRHIDGRSLKNISSVFGYQIDSDTFDIEYAYTDLRKR